MPTSRRESGEAADTEPRPGEEQEELQPLSAIRFPPEEEAALLSESNAEKSTANELFKSAQYSQAISVYDRALASVPNYLEYEIAVLKSNIAACHLKLSDWKAAVDEATKSLEALDRLETPPASKSDGNEVEGSEGARPGNRNGLDKHLHHAAAPTKDDGGVVELADDEENEAEALEKIEKDDRRKNDIRRIRAKALMRRARAKSEQGGWGNLQGALEDYQTLSPLSSTLAPSDAKIVNTALRSLPAQIAAAKEKEMGEMMGKLKELGNGFLKPFGLSTDSFKFEKDEKTGGYSIGMNG
ncbi:MAG: hypothetical protein L6R38_004227 [Xanthoria sp. 2 TBL-2021]|nr:MAG: hypothetical protein L6R38_004227 [Xanthoria sp. 2 TBL-2021]